MVPISFLKFRTSVESIFIPGSRRVGPDLLCVKGLTLNVARYLLINSITALDLIIASLKLHTNAKLLNISNLFSKFSRIATYCSRFYMSYGTSLHLVLALHGSYQGFKKSKYLRIILRFFY